MHYPIFLSEKDLIQSILGYGEKDVGSFGLLSDFAMKLECLKVGSDLLPDLVEFYTWIHTNLSHVLTKEQASTVSISRIIDQAEKNMSRESGSHLRDLYMRVQKGYEDYIGVSVGACKTATITDDTNVLHFLSGIIILTFSQ